MSLLRFFRPEPRKSPASQAKERLQILLAHERSTRSSPDFLPQLQHELVQVISKYIKIDTDKIAIKLDRGEGVSVLEVNIELPNASDTAARGTATAANR